MGANIYVENDFLAYYKGDISPGDTFWHFLESLQGCSRSIFFDEIVRKVEGAGTSLDKPEPALNVQFEFIWVGHLAPAEYTHWQDWCGTILAREADYSVTDKLHRNFEGALPYQPMGALVTMTTMATRVKTRTIREARRNRAAKRFPPGEKA